MARRPRTSPIEDIFSLSSLLPWQVGLVLAALAFGGLHYVSGLPLPETAPLEPSGSVFFVLEVACIQIADYAKYIAAVFFVTAAGVSWWSRKKRGAIVETVASTQDMNAISWQDFEKLTAAYFKAKGFEVIEQGGPSADGGVDLILKMGRDRYFVQCKHWKARKVGVAIVRELYGVMHAENVVGGFVVASGDFTADAKAFAQGRSIDLVDGRGILKTFRRPRTEAPETPKAPEAAGAYCPRCGSTMVLRRARKGASSFFGCSTYPKCKGTVPYA